ncbi:MAG: hypothetical protein IKW71_03095 [Elusimicrobiaceae bacterium]|nr:hypothetical protein [Elusimicrobiaceae bacterium]
MRSLQNEAAAHCPHGCEAFDVTYWSLVRADENDDLKNAILGGELNLVRCPECGTYFHHDGEIIYFDALAQLLVFVFSPKDKPRAHELTQKMEHDYQVIKNSLLKEMHLDYPPICVFGLEELQHLLHHEEKLTAESEVIAAAAATQGFEVARLQPAYARQHHFPFYIPAPIANKPTANDYALAAAKVLKSGLNSTLLLNFKDHMSAPQAHLPVLL